MFEQPGIGVDDLAWIHRDQFVHYVELARALGDPSDWPRFRCQLHRSLHAAFALDAAVATDGHPTRDRTDDVLDQARACHDPTTDWPGFRETLWSLRDRLADGL